MKNRILSIIIAALLFQTNADAASVAELMHYAFLPVGKCLYVWGGGWNEADSGAGEEAMTVGICDRWIDFFDANDSAYDYKKTKYQIHNGLDCTGYVGWNMYQLFGNKYSDSGYVFLSRNTAKAYSQIFSGQFTAKGDVSDYQCGDIMSSDNHAYIVIGECEDKSVLFLHASPPNVSLCGTYTPSGNKNSVAVSLAEEYMQRYYGECYAKYPKVSRNTSYLTDYNRMRWDEAILTDSDGYRQMAPQEILSDIFETTKIYINGERLKTDSSLFFVNDRIYAPLKQVAEALGAEVIWNEEERAVTVSKDTLQAKVFTKNNKISANGKLTEEFEVYIINDRTYIPLRLICEALGKSVDWDNSRKAAVIN